MPKIQGGRIAVGAWCRTKLHTCREEHNAVVVVETFTSLLHSINFDTQKVLKKVSATVGVIVETFSIVYAHTPLQSLKQSTSSK